MEDTAIKDLLDNIQILIEKGENSLAKEFLNKLVVISPKVIEAYSFLGVISLMEGDFEEAEKHLKNGLQIDCRDYDLNYNLGYLYQCLNMKFESVIYYKRALFQLRNDEEYNKLLRIIDDIEYGHIDPQTVQSQRNYKNQVKTYAKARLLNPNEECDITQYIVENKTINDERIKILYASIEIANNTNLLANAFRKEGYQAYCVNYYPTYLEYNSDIEIDIMKFQVGECRLELIDLVAFLISEFDVFHFVFNTSLMLDFSDINILKKLNKKVIMHNLGSEIRLYSKALKMNPYWELVADTYFKSCSEVDNLNKMKYLAEYIDNCLTCDGELIEYVRDIYKKCFLYKVPICLEKYPYNELVEKPKVLIVHAPTNPEVKGSKYIIETLQLLKKELDFDFKLVQHLKHSEAIELYIEADIIIDQIIIGEYGSLAIECMSLGRPVICWISEHSQKKLPVELPIVSANKDNLYEKLKVLILDGALRKELGKKGRLYVEKYHDARKIAISMEKIYSEI